ncbi:MAG: hypothetical protein HY831_02755 [Candidatus Aenigmarchaeota archaeon]|nr:hypothetical protein [Candidatus Aenigmarchaeota archaeon]
MLWENSERIDSMEHYRDYWDNFSQYPYLYYCRRCIRNFNTKVRVKLCNKCLKDDIVELPGNTVNVPMSRLRTGKKRFSLDFLDKKLFKKEDETEEKKFNIKESMDNFAKRWDNLISKLKKDVKKNDSNPDINPESQRKFTFINKKAQQDLENYEKEKTKFSIFKKSVEELPSYRYEDDERLIEQPSQKISSSLKDMIERLKKQ